MNPVSNRVPAVSRREFVQTCALSAAALASGAVLGCRTTSPAGRGWSGPATRTLLLDHDWLFGGKFTEAATRPDFADSAFKRVTLPHCVAELAWQKWEPASWEDRWIYRRHLALPREFKDRRLFLHFDGVTAGATPVINGQALPEHLGGYLPFAYEITGLTRSGDNVLAVTVDSRWLNVPPAGSPKGTSAVDYYIPGGITRSVSLRAVPPIFISDLFAKPVAVLDPQRRVEVVCTVDVGLAPLKEALIKVELTDGERLLAAASQPLSLDQPGEKQISLTLSNLGNIALWEPSSPKLYQVVATLLVGDKPVHDYRTRIGFRDARFEVEGFFLNGRRFQLFGLDRHELYPYVGSAMPPRVMRRDAEILRRQFNCNIVRCSHYPQSEAFFDACDELGLMAWEEIPGWQYIGDAPWKDLAVRDVRDMVKRDRNHASIVIWGVRINESPNDPEFYSRTKAAAKALDDSRPTSGAMNRYSKQDWLQDVYAYDDYHAAPDGSVGVREPLPGVPYFLAEGVGQFAYGNPKPGFGRKYRRAAELKIQYAQALAHAQIHSKAATMSRIGGVIAWCAFDYGSPINSHQGVKCPGVADVFRIPKLGASFYLAQGDPKLRPVIEPNFYWDFGPQSPAGPGEKAAIFSNCDRLEVFIDDHLHATLEPDRAAFPHLAHPPFFTHLTRSGNAWPVLRIDGYLGGNRVISRSFASDPSADQFLLELDDQALVADGSDATRLVFRVADKFGSTRAFATGEVLLEITGPGAIVGDNPFSLADSGGVGAVWIRAAYGRAGRIRVAATHSRLGQKTVELTVVPTTA